MKRLTVNAPSRWSAEVATVTELRRNAVDFVNVEAVTAKADVPDEKATIVVTRPEGRRETFDVYVTMKGDAQ